MAIMDFDLALGPDGNHAVENKSDSAITDVDTNAFNLLLMGTINQGNCCLYFDPFEITFFICIHHGNSRYCKQLSVLYLNFLVCG